jgi:hypothetical protein
MSTFKGDYTAIKQFTIDKFKEQLTLIREYVSQPLPMSGSTHRLKGAIENIEEEQNRISFSFVMQDIVLIYDINMASKKIGTIVKAYNKVLNHDNYPSYKLLPISSLNFSFSPAKNHNGFYNYQFEGKEYCSGNKSDAFFDAYILNISKEFFPEDI